MIQAAFDANDHFRLVPYEQDFLLVQTSSLS